MTISEPPRDPESRVEDLAANTALLQAELPDHRFVDSSYLRWLYDRNPFGAAFEASADEDGVRAAHYALVPQRYRDADGPAPFVFSLNAVTRSGTQRRGWFRRLGAEVYRRAADAGIRCVVGVSNANSTPPVVRHMGWRLCGPLPVRLALPVPHRHGSVWTEPVTAELLARPDVASVLDELDGRPARAWTNTWTAEHLRWRLAAPNSGPYVLHVADDVVAVSTADRAGPVPAAVLLKLLPRSGGAEVVDGAAVVRAACAHHRAPFAVVAGWNRWVRLPAVPVPTRLRPVPLNLIVRSLDPALDQERVAFDTFEFLDMDAY